ncbi:MAG: hypothetical protein NT166_03685 [Candidatus Aminicenantes bacterium]|nr:hypothetical protein [Candidatus Aminicenantes bacterium]
MNLKSQITLTAILLFATLSLPIFPGNSVKKEIYVYDTFENFKLEKPFKVYHSEEEYNNDPKVKNNTGFIVSIRTIDGQDFWNTTQHDKVPGRYAKQYNDFIGINIRDAGKLKIAIGLYDTVERMHKFVALKYYKTDNCFEELEKDISTIFRGKKDLIKIIYRYNKASDAIIYQEHRVPDFHLAKYLESMIANGKLSSLDAAEIKKQGDEEKILWFDIQKKYIKQIKTISDIKPGEQLAQAKKSEPGQRKSAFIPPPQVPDDPLTALENDPLLSFVMAMNNRRKERFQASLPSAPLPAIFRPTIPRPKYPGILGDYITGINSVNPMIAANAALPEMTPDAPALPPPPPQTITTEVNQLNQYTRFGEWTLDYDLNGNVRRKGTQKFTYDYRNNLVHYEDVYNKADYKFDPFNRRVETNVNGKVTHYYYDGQQMIEERDGDDQVTRQYVYGNGVDEIIFMTIFQGPYAGDYYFHTDAIGSVTAITDKEGKLVERVSYDIYGMPTFMDYLTDPANPVKRESSIIGNKILWHGRLYDPESNMYYFRNRMYDPTMGRFLQTDAMGYQDSMNLYQGFNSNPVNFTDPFGLEPVQEFAGVVADIVNAMNNSKNKVGLSIGGQASNTLLYLGKIKLSLKPPLPRPLPASTEPFNTIKGRYIYTRKGGWIDMSHFLFYAGRAYTYKIQKENAKWLLGNSFFPFMDFAAQLQISRDAIMSPGGEAMQEGYMQEKMDTLVSTHSAYSYEDLPSDKFGIIFALQYFNPASKLTLGEQVANFLNNVLGATDPTAAPNWNMIPKDDSKNPPIQTNRTTTPIYTSEDEEKLRVFFQWLKALYR